MATLSASNVNLTLGTDQITGTLSLGSQTLEVTAGGGVGTLTLGTMGAQTYDALTDTPNKKSGSIGRFVRVRDDGLAHRYTKGLKERDRITSVPQYKMILSGAENDPTVDLDVQALGNYIVVDHNDNTGTITYNFQNAENGDGGWLIVISGGNAEVLAFEAEGGAGNISYGDQDLIDISGYTDGQFTEIGWSKMNDYVLLHFFNIIHP